MPTVGKVNLNTVAEIVKTDSPRKFAEQFLREKELKKQMLESMPKSVKFLDKMKTFQGEVPNIIINALGTGLVAPVFIKHNFMSKTDEDTRTYTAWRQPVSAVLAVITQAGLVIPFNKLINNMKNNGEYTDLKYNDTAFQDLDYHKNQIKKENPKLSKDEIKKLAEERQYKQLEDMVENLYNNDKIEIKTKNGKAFIEGQKITELLEQTTDSMLKNKNATPEELEVIKELQKGIKDKKTIKELHNIAKNGIKESNFVYEVAQKHISNIAGNIKGEKQGKGLIVSLMILPVTCMLLNKIYPWFMKVAFPNLADKKASQKKDGDTFSKSEASANRKAGA